jgi:hypothetical protein
MHCEARHAAATGRKATGQEELSALSPGFGHVGMVLQAHATAFAGQFPKRDGKRHKGEQSNNCALTGEQRTRYADVTLRQLRVRDRGVAILSATDGVLWWPGQRGGEGGGPAENGETRSIAGSFSSQIIPVMASRTLSGAGGEPPLPGCALPACFRGLPGRYVRDRGHRLQGRWVRPGGRDWQGSGRRAASRPLRHRAAAAGRRGSAPSPLPPAPPPKATPGGWCTRWTRAACCAARTTPTAAAAWTSPTDQTCTT